MIAPVEPTDPLVAVLTWALTEVAGRFSVPQKHRWVLPYLAILIASLLMVTQEALAGGDPFTVEVLIRGFGAGAAAIAGASSVSSAKKARGTRKKKGKEDPPDVAS